MSQFPEPFLKMVIEGAADFADCDTPLGYCVTRYAQEVLGWQIQDDIDSLVEECERHEFVRGATEAGIPMSVIEGKTTLRDHFSQDYIDEQCGRKKA